MVDWEKPELKNTKPKKKIEKLNCIKMKDFYASKDPVKKAKSKKK